MPKLAQRNNCTGCTACASACPRDCIAMEADKNGFLCPRVDGEKCVECGLCQKTCPILNKTEPAEEKTLAYAACSLDEAVRLESSSGGVFTELARAVLREGGVVFGAAYDENFCVRHVCAESLAELELLRGAKYAQSELGDTFRQVKAALKERRVLFSGTPCQVAGLKAFLGRECAGLVTVDFVCHSVPSPMAWREYVKYRAEQDNGGELPAAINLRSKKTGWSRYQYSNLFEYATGASHTAQSGQSLYMKLFVGGYISRPSCENCAFKGYSRVSDLTLGDFWGIWDIAPEMDDDKGTSVILCHTAIGRELLERISGRLTMKPVTLEEASRQNSAMLVAAKPNERRTEALELIARGDIGACADWFRLRKETAAQKLRRLVGRLLGRG